MAPLIEFTESGFYCPQADVYIDPWKRVDKAIITHAHSDHARPGHKSYLCHSLSEKVIKARLSPNAKVDTLEYGSSLYINGVKIILYPAGHIAGSAQVYLEHKSERWVLSGDYNTQADETHSTFEPVPCDHFITESTFGLPVFQWPSPSSVFEKINNWWQENSEQQQASIIMAYSLGKAQRIIQNVNHAIGPVYVHSSVHNMNKALEASGMQLKPTKLLKEPEGKNLANALIICPPGTQDSIWMKKIKNPRMAFASGWMHLRGTRRRRSVETGFVLSDHADWEGLNSAIKNTGAENIYVTHGYSDIFTKWLNEQGYSASSLRTAFEGESIENTNDAL